jgi:hypothetical protein
VNFAEQSYGCLLASLHEPPFALASHVNRSSYLSVILWYNEPIDNLVHRFRTLSFESLLSNIKSIAAHRRPAYDLVCHRKTSTLLVDHMLRRVSHLLSLPHSALCEFALTVCCSDFHHDLDPKLLPENFIDSIIHYEYMDVLINAVSSSALPRSDCLKLYRKNEKHDKVRHEKEGLERYTADWNA